MATGRSAIRHFISIANPPKVLMPCYVPEGVIVPFQKMKVPIKFYLLNDNLTPDLDSLKAGITKGATVVIIHYFGFPTDTSVIREIVNDAGGLLFEDCAHALFGPASKARNADIALWSLNKFLPVVDGAILRSRRGDIDVTCSISKELPWQVMNAYHRHLDINTEMIGSKDTLLADKSNVAYEEYYRAIADCMPYAQSQESRCVEASISFTELNYTHQTNARRINHGLPLLFYWNDSPNIAPFAYPIIVRPPLRRDQVVNELVEVGILPVTLISKWDHIPKEGGFTAERDFINSHLLLPVGVGVTSDVTDKITTVLQRLVREVV